MSELKMLPEGSPNARYIIVASSPTMYDIKKGRAFSGPAGKLFDRLLHRAGISRSDCYILYTVPTHQRRMADIWTTKKSERSKTKQYHALGAAHVTSEYQSYEKELYENIRGSTAKTIIAFGQLALFALTRHTDITKRRGSILSSDSFPEKRIIPTISPEAIFKISKYEFYIKFDLVRAAQESNRPSLQLPERELITEPTFAEAINYIRACRSREYVGFDIETTRTASVGKFQDWEISCLSLSHSVTSAICIPFLDSQRNDYFTVEQETEIWLELRALLTDPKVKKILQNATFDLSFILKKYNFMVWPVEDTMIAQGILTPDFEKDLGFLTSIHTREPYYKDEGKQHIRFNTGGWAAFKIYSAKDAAVLIEIFMSQKEELEQNKMWETYYYQKELLAPLLFMTKKGILIDVEGRKAPSKALERETAELRLFLNRKVGYEINPLSPAQLMKYFYTEKKVKPFVKDERPTIDVDALKRLVALGFEEAEMILKIRSNSKLRGTYMEMALDSDSRLRSSINPIGTRTGRLSSSASIFGTGGNIQNIPAAYKGFMLADPGYLCYNIDLAQAENRIVAYIAPELTMIEAFETKTDLHSLTASRITGKSIEEIIYEDKNNIYAPLGSGKKTWRAYGKQANHALNYGLGERAFALRLEIQVKDAKRIRDAYLSSYPGIVQFHNWIRTQLKSDRTITNLLGRKRIFFDAMNESLFQAAYAQIPQSTVGDIINRRGLLYLYEDEIFKHLELLNQVHDSINPQIPISVGFHYHAACMIALKNSLEAPLYWRARTFSIPADFSVGINFKDQHKITVTSDIDETAEQIERAYYKAIGKVA